ncbi:unnamed protein product [Protopolystoma xenopodis]|uniref:Uncharacterized protein n=1 Tax=Protopolystoma xenopodis TaxID=117903 RepID=A0A448WV12_9PLAT|nr:unnamed protein product [Protopolystoma xenopodis]
MSTSGPSHVLNPYLVAYVSGIGFGLIGALIHLIDLLLALSGPGISLDLDGSTAYLLLAALDVFCFTLFQIVWSLILWISFEQLAYLQIIAVYFLHLLVACLLHY